MLQLNGECRGFEPKGGQYTAIFLVNILGSLTFFWCASCGVQFCCSLKVSPDLISRVTDAVLDEVREWQSRVLDRMYPIVIFDALRVKIRDTESRTVKNKAVYVALGVSRDGRREVLGLCPATPIRINAVVPEAERGGALTGLRLDGLHVLPGPGQVPHCLRVRVGNPDGRETPGTVLTRPHRRIPPVCLDAIRGAPRHTSRGDDHAVVAGLHDLPKETLTAGAGFISDAESQPIRTQALDQAQTCGPRVRNRSRSLRPGRADGHRKRIHVDIQTHIGTVF